MVDNLITLFFFQTSQQLNIAPAPAPSSAPAPPRPSSGGRGNHQWNGRDYLLSWREGQNGLSWSQVLLIMNNTNVQ